MGVLLITSGAIIHSGKQGGREGARQVDTGSRDTGAVTRKWKAPRGRGRKWDRDQRGLNCTELTSQSEAAKLEISLTVREADFGCVRSNRRVVLREQDEGARLLALCCLFSQTAWRRTALDRAAGADLLRLNL